MNAKFSPGILVTSCILALTSTAVSLALGRDSFAIPRSDDWSYLNVTFDFAQTGSFDLNGWVHMMFITQGMMGALLTNLFGPKILVLHGFVICCSVLGLCALYWLARRLLSLSFSIIAVIVTGVGPLWLYLSITFMTDVPAWSLAALSLALGVHAMSRLSVAWLIAASGVSILAFGIREYAVIPLLALLLWVVITPHPKCFKMWAGLLACVGSAATAVFLFWRKDLPGSVTTVASPVFESLTLSSRLLFTLALLLVPFLAISVCLVMHSRTRLTQQVRRFWVGALVGLLVGAGIASLASFQLIGNTIHPYGSSWTSVGDGVRSLPLWGFRGLTIVGALSLLTFSAGVGSLIQSHYRRLWQTSIERPGKSVGVASLYIFVSAVVVVVYIIAIFSVGAPAFDRYLILVVPLLGIVVLWFGTRFREPSLSWPQKVTTAVVLVMTGAVGIVITDGLNQVDGLRWRVASALAESGIPSYKIDAGDTWFRYHQSQAPGVAQVGSLGNLIPGRTWWQTFFEGSTFCRMVAIESETDLQAMYGPALSIQEERTLLGTPFRVIVFPGPDPC